MIDINGMAHVILTVSQFDKAHKFYSGLLPEFGMKKVEDGPDLLYYVAHAQQLAYANVTQNLPKKVSSNIE